MLKQIIASAVILIVLFAVYVIVTLARDKMMGPKVPHGCPGDCSSCESLCDAYKEKLEKENMKNDRDAEER